MAVSDVYSTRDAAAYLRVSPASVRRWADAGLIGVQRIGLRQERRFALADLERFAAAGRRGAAAATAPAPEPHRHHPMPEERPGTPGGARLEAHDHFATFYDSDGDRLRLSVPFLRDGLLAGQRCFLAASEELADEYCQALSQESGVDVEAALAGGALVTRSSAPGSTPREAVAGWEQLWWNALGHGARAIRVVGEMATYESFATAQEMLDYEVAYDSLAKRLPVMTLCQYDVRRFDGTTVMGAIQVHPDLFSKRISDFLI
jgi:excisionase family DNA binding protein